MIAHDDTNRRRVRWWGGLVLAALLIASACSVDDSDSSDESARTLTDDAATEAPVEAPAAAEATEEAAREEAPASDEPVQEPMQEEAGTAASLIGLTPADIGRDIVFTAVVEVGVDDVATAGEAAVDAIAAVGGFVFGQESTGGAEPRSVFVFKVAPDDFAVAVEALAGIGELRSQSVTADDVTERVVDLESRIEVAELGVARLRAAMEAATDLEDFAQLEGLLLARESDLEVMRGQIRTLQDRIDLATITLVLTQDRLQNSVELSVSFYEGHDDGVSCVGRDDLRVEEGAAVTVCFEVLNSGDQTLTELALTDTGLGIDEDTELVRVFGSLDEAIAPGQSIVVAHELEPERDARLRARVNATPVVTAEGDPAGPPVSASRNLTIGVVASDDAPGFGDGFEAGARVLSALWTGVVVAFGFLAPLLVLVPLVALVVWLLRRGIRLRRDPESATESAQPE